MGIESDVHWGYDLDFDPWPRREWLSLGVKETTCECLSGSFQLIPVIPTHSLQSRSKARGFAQPRSEKAQEPWRISGLLP